MEKSRQRAPYPEVIDEKGLVSRKRAFTETLITLGFWGVIIYFLAIFITFLLWYFGVKLMYYEIYSEGFQEMQRLFGNAVLITSIVMITLLCWSCYNSILVKIKGERRHSRVSICFDKDMAKFFNIDLDTLEKIKKYPRLSLLFQQDNLIFTITDLPAAPNE
jgi:poly-beta-1,6-N-acetyl-D-glucosamine biosynthesis protein PgaD